MTVIIQARDKILYVNHNGFKTMRLSYRLLVILAFALSCAETKPDASDVVNIIKKFSQDLQSSPSGYNFHHHGDSVHPGEYNADINHGKAKIAGQHGPEKLAEMNSHSKGGTYRVAGGYGFVISHDYGSQSNHAEALHDNAPFGASNPDHASIAVLQLVNDDSGGSSTGLDAKRESVGSGKSDGLDSYIEKEIYGYMEYDKLVKDGKKRPSVNPGEYHGSHDHDGKEKYHSDDGRGESNNGGDEGRYVESEKYDGSEDYNESEHYGALRAGHDNDHVDDGEVEKYVDLEKYGEIDGYNSEERADLYEGYGEGESNHEEYRPFDPKDQFVNRNENYGKPSTHAESIGYKRHPEYEEIRNSFLDDFFKEYNQFSEGANIQAGFKNDHSYDDGYHGDHGFEDKNSFYNEGGESGKDFFDDADSKGDHYEEENGETNSKFGNKAGHKKGCKTAGYRNVLHKDEYTKDHTFYDHAKNDGHFDKHGDYAEHDSQHEGNYEKGGHHDSHSDYDHHGKANSEDEGHYSDDDISKNHEYGYKSYFDDNSEYSEKGDGHYGSEYEEGHNAPSSESYY